jgi:hypothetical protein
MNVMAPVTSIETLPTELLEHLGERKIKPGEGDLWVFAFALLQRAPYSAE